MRDALAELPLTRRQKATVAVAFAMSLAGLGIAFWQLVAELQQIGAPL